jgi:hypothetical protein
MLCVVSVLIANRAFAVSVYECTTRDGDMRFQDFPCAAGEVSRQRQLVDDRDESPPPDPAPSDAIATRETDSATDCESQEVPHVELHEPAHGFLCQREEDGTRYLSDDGIGLRRAVPLAMLSYPSRGLAQAYGKDGIGISAPEVNPFPRTRSSHEAIGTTYVWVDDRCVVIDGWRRCQELEKLLKDAERRLSRAFSDKTALIQTEIEQLRARGSDCSAVQAR